MTERRPEPAGGEAAGRQRVRRGLTAFGGAALAGVVVTLVVPLTVIGRMSGPSEPAEPTPRPAHTGPDRYVSLKDDCAYLDEDLLAGYIRPGAPKDPGKDSGKDRAESRPEGTGSVGGTRMCTWYAGKRDRHPGRSVRVLVDLDKPASYRSGTDEAAREFASARQAAEEAARPGELPEPVPGLGDEAFATLTTFRGARAHVHVRRANIVYEVEVGAGLRERTGDADAAEVARVCREAAKAAVAAQG